MEARPVALAVVGAAPVLTSGGWLAGALAGGALVAIAAGAAVAAGAAATAPAATAGWPP